MLKLNSNCIIYNRNDAYIIRNIETGRYYLLSESQYNFINQNFGNSHSTSIKANSFEGQDQFVNKLLEIGVLINEKDNHKFLSTSISRKRIAYADIFHFRFFILNPDLLCQKILQYGKFVLNRYVLVIVGILVMIGTVSMFFIWNRFSGFSKHMSLTTYLLMIYLSSIVLSVGHELSHALLCKYYGGIVSEMGIAFLYLGPCFYCNISDSYLFKEKYKRVMVALVGIIYDILITLVTINFLYFIFGFPEVYVKEYARFSIMTLLFELNPLLKNDGYYVITEALSIYNLREKAFRVMKSYYFLSKKEKRENMIYICYGILSIIYLLLHLSILTYSVALLIKMFAI